MKLLYRTLVPVGLRPDADRNARLLTLFSVYFLNLQLFKFEVSKIFYEETGALPSSWHEMYSYFFKPLEWVQDYYNPMEHDKAHSSAKSSEFREALQNERLLIAVEALDQDFVIGAPTETHE